ncbi:MAG: metal-dependent hydrolase, partial [Halobellus sp.]|uniref:metal-dependent hydrolase n=1 Tax=Halobellus sp. TaxID=1979212 RepID=UPI0035D4BAF0
MLPWGHLAVGYLLYTFGTHLLQRSAPAGQAVLLLAVGTQLPDLVDKPLNWWLDIFDGRAIGHSMFAAVVISILFFSVMRRYDREDLAVALSVGLVSHL